MMKAYILEKISSNFSSFSEFTKFLYFCKTLIKVKKDISKKSAANVPPLLILKEFNFLWFCTYLRNWDFFVFHFHSTANIHWKNLKLLIFSEFLRKLFWLLEKDLKQGCPNCHLHHRMNLLSKNNFFNILNNLTNLTKLTNFINLSNPTNLANRANIANFANLANFAKLTNLTNLASLANLPT